MIFADIQKTEDWKQKLLGTDLRRSILSISFAIGTTCWAIILVFNAIFQIVSQQSSEGGLQHLMYGDHSRLLLEAMSSQLSLMAVPIICAIPYTSAFIDDFRSGFLIMYLPRCGVKEYIKGKILSTVFSGGLVLFAGTLIAYVALWLITSPMQIAPAPDAMKEPTLAPVIKKGIIFALSGSVWSVVGGLSASVTMNKYMAYASPFIFYYLLVILCERYIKGIYVLNPQEWLRPQGVWPGEDWGIALILIEFIIAAAMIYSISIYKKLRDD